MSFPRTGRALLYLASGRTILYRVSVAGKIRGAARAVGDSTAAATVSPEGGDPVVRVFGGGGGDSTVTVSRCSGGDGCVYGSYCILRSFVRGSENDRGGGCHMRYTRNAASAFQAQ
jgi:hypothetical protein